LRVHVYVFTAMMHWRLVVGKRSAQRKGGKFMLKHSWRVGVAAATLAGLTVAFGGGASAANLVQNGDFNLPGAASAQWLQQGSTFITGWTNHDDYTGYIPQGQTPDQNWCCTLTGSAGPGYGVANGMVGPPSGNASLVIDGTNGFGPGGQGYGYIEQIISGLVSGSTYTLSFWQAASEEFGRGGGQSENFVASLGDQSFTSTIMNVSDQGFVPWNEFSTTFTWDGVSNALQIAGVGSGDPAFPLLADVSLTGSVGGVPEPSTWAMIVAGFAGISVLARARRKAIAVA
jgi:hypothetical protein